MAYWSEFQSPQCYSAEQLLAIYNVPSGNTIPEATFLSICPSLLYQQVTGACATQTNKTHSSLEAAKGEINVLKLGIAEYINLLVLILIIEIANA